MLYYLDLDGNRKKLDPKNPEPGVYLGVDHWTYLAIEATSRSDLKSFSEAPEHYKAPGSKVTSDMIIGTQYHSYILEPELFENNYFLYDGKRDKRIEEYKLLLEKSGGPEYVYKPSDLEKMQAMKRALMRYPKAARLLQGPGPKEITVIAEDPDTGMILKGRIDAARIDHGYIVDLKTTANASWEKFRWSIRDYGYDLQAAFYIHICSLSPPLSNLDKFIIVAQEKTERTRYKVRVMKIHDHDVSRSKIDVLNLLSELKSWIASGMPYPDEFIERDTYSLD